MAYYNNVSLEIAGSDVFCGFGRAMGYNAHQFGQRTPDVARAWDTFVTLVATTIKLE